MKFFSLILYIIVLRMDEGFFFCTIIFFYSRKCEWNFDRINNFEFQHLPFFEKSEFVKSLRPSAALLLTNDPFFISDDPVTSCSDHCKTLFFWTPHKFAYPTYFWIFSYKKFIISSWNTYLSCRKTFVINYCNVWPKKILNNCFFGCPN